MSNNSPYARRARITIREAGLADKVDEVLISSFNELVQYGPGGKIPVLVTDSGQSLCESLIITRYLNDISGGGLLPRATEALEKVIGEEGGSVTLASIALVAALGYADWRAPEDDWRVARPNLVAYFDRLMQRPAFAETAPNFT